MWGSIALVSSGLALAAFIVAAGVTLAAIKAREKEDLIRAAGEGDRPALIQDALEVFRVNTAGLTKDQQYHIAIEQIRARAIRFSIAAVVICVLALLATGTAVYAISRPSAGSEPRQADGGALPTVIDEAGVSPESLPETVEPPRYRLCRHPSHGVEFYRSIGIKEHAGPWQGGGSSQIPFCNSVLGPLRGEHPERKYEIVGSREEVDKDFWGSASYRYFCTINELEPVYVERSSVECGEEDSSSRVGS